MLNLMTILSLSFKLKFKTFKFKKILKKHRRFICSLNSRGSNSIFLDDNCIVKIAVLLFKFWNKKCLQSPCWFHTKARPAACIIVIISLNYVTTSLLLLFLISGISDSNPWYYVNMWFLLLYLNTPHYSYIMKRMNYDIAS